jgi:transcriptional regulator with XRE-family HTH domain
MTLADRLKQVREALGETQKSICARLEIGVGTWQALERDSRLPKTETLERLAALGFSIDWMVTGNGAMRIASAAPPPIGSGETVLRDPPRHPIPIELEQTLNTITGVLRWGPAGYRLAHHNARHLVDLLAEAMQKLPEQ